MWADRNIALRMSEPILWFATILFLFQCTLAAQNNPVNEPDARSGEATAARTSSKSELSKTYDRSVWNRRDVGTHDIGCRLATRYSPQAQMEMGRSYAHQIETTRKLIGDPIIVSYINRIGQDLTRNSDTHVQFTFEIIDTDEINAFSLPGGFVFLDSGLILAADNEAEVAGVVSHEIAHVAACHAAQQMAHDELTDVGSMPLIIRLAIRPMIQNTIYPKSTRNFESEADLMGIELLYKAGYDPQALSSFLEKARALKKQDRRSLINAFDSPSQVTDRTTKTQSKIDALLTPASGYKVDTSEFHEVKNRLAELKHQKMGNITAEQLKRSGSP